MKFFAICAGMVAAVPAVIGTQLEGPYYFATQANSPGGSVNLTATNNQVVLDNQLPAREFLFYLNPDLVGNMTVQGFSEGFNFVYADGTDGTVRYTNGGEQPPAGAIIDQWAITALESDPSSKVVQFRGGQLQACTTNTTNVTNLVATNSTLPDCQSVFLVSLSSQRNGSQDCP
ncbi:MAG: hypothetical protein M1821_003363 [Bathelium mastoideum]|nr:MAG: hypothetical protein M1821_003363 [Bathelium mastoideum]KAI9686083.1 MAG: hypothetical protein M1822_004066 [Bathelium mastoideum]